MVNLGLFSRSEHCHGRHCVTSWAVAYRDLVSGMVYLSIGAHQG